MKPIDRGDVWKPMGVILRPGDLEQIVRILSSRGAPAIHTSTHEYESIRELVDGHGSRRLRNLSLRLGDVTLSFHNVLGLELRRTPWHHDSKSIVEFEQVKAYVQDRQSAKLRWIARLPSPTALYVASVVIFFFVVPTIHNSAISLWLELLALALIPFSLSRTIAESGVLSRISLKSKSKDVPWSPAPVTSPTLGTPDVKSDKGPSDRQVDVTQALCDAENALRDFIGVTLREAYGRDWHDQSGVSAERVAKWKERKDTEGKRQESGVVDERLIYYADFYDLFPILRKHWERFAPALGDQRTMEVYLKTLERLRDPDAHRRELLPHQKHLASGIAGEIRGRIARYRAKRESPVDCFPRIESARDSLGNIWTPDGEFATLSTVRTAMVLRPGDHIDYVITATDPDGAPLEFGISSGLALTKWQASNELSFDIRETDISEDMLVWLYVRSTRSYHAHAIYDDCVAFRYAVLPRPRETMGATTR